MTDAPPDQPEAEWRFETAHVGRRVLVFSEVDSTNSLALGLPGGPGDDLGGVALLARDQRGGRGRFGRVWRSRPGSSMLLSVVVTPPPALQRPVILTAWAALSVAEAVEDLAGVKARIKWPNDLLIDGKKVCGILIEQRAAAGPGGAARTVAGVGLNLNQMADEFAAHGLPDATSLSVFAGRSIGLEEAVGCVVRRLDRHYARMRDGALAGVEADWRARTGLVDREVVVSLGDGTARAGRLVDLAFDRVGVEAGAGEVVALVPETIEHIRVA